MHASTSSELLESTPVTRRSVGLAAALLTGAPVAALACPVCGFVGTSNSTWAYQAMTGLLILLPLTLIGALVLWLARCTALADRERDSMSGVVDRAPLDRFETRVPVSGIRCSTLSRAVEAPVAVATAQSGRSFRSDCL